MISYQPKWLKFLPLFLRKKFEHRPSLQAALANTVWLSADKLLRMGVGFFIGVWTARYLGAEQYGLWNYAAAFAGLFGVLASLGMDGMIVQELVKNPERKNELLGTAFILKLLGGLVAVILSALVISLVRTGENLTYYLVLLSATAFIFQATNVIEFYFQAKMQSKYTVYATATAFSAMTLLKIGLLIIGAPLIAFSGTVLFEAILTAVLFLVAYHVNSQNVKLWQFNLLFAKELIKQSWPLILSGFAISIYMRIDQVMLGKIINDKAVGIYSAAVRISEVWYFLPLVVVSSVFPAIIMAKKTDQTIYLKRLQKLYDVLILLALFVAIPMTFFSDWLVALLYGPEYIEAGHILSIHIWTSIFVFLGVVNSRVLITENLQKVFFYNTALCGVVNILLNYILIPMHGAVGAAYATLISQALGLVFNFFVKQLRVYFFMQIRALLIFPHFLVKVRCR